MVKHILFSLQGSSYSFLKKCLHFLFCWYGSLCSQSGYTDACCCMCIKNSIFNLAAFAEADCQCCTKSITRCCRVYCFYFKTFDKLKFFSSYKEELLFRPFSGVHTEVLHVHKAICRFRGIFIGTILISGKCFCFCFVW